MIKAEKYLESKGIQTSMVSLSFLNEDEESVNITQRMVNLVELMQEYSDHSAQPFKELIDELESYIDFIGDRLSELEAFVSTRSYLSCPPELVEEGEKRRAKISALRLAAYGHKTEEG